MGGTPQQIHDTGQSRPDTKAGTRDVRVTSRRQIRSHADRGAVVCGVRDHAERPADGPTADAAKEPPSMIEFDVVWNGVNDGHDGDLLTGDRQPEKRTGAPLRDMSGVVRSAVIAALPVSRVLACSFRDLVERTGCTPQTVNSVLYRLRLDNRLLSEAMPAETVRALAPKLYWRRW